MSNQSSFRWRTIVEVAVISIVIYVFLGTPGLPSSSIQQASNVHEDIPRSRAKVEALVYPDKDLKCPKHEVNVKVFSTSPLILYLDGFLSEHEANHFVDIRCVISTDCKLLMLTYR